MQRIRQTDGLVHGAIVGCRDWQGRWLLIRRAAHVALAPMKVCFPGGAVEVQEDHAAAAAREFREELGVDVRIVQLIWRYTFDDRPLTLWGYLGELSDQPLAPDPDEVAEVLWLTAEQAAAHPDGLPRTADFIAALEEALTTKDAKDTEGGR